MSDALPEQVGAEDLLRAFLAATSHGLALLDAHGRPLWVNERLTRILGYSAEELRALSCEQLTHPGDVAAELALFEELASGRRDRFELHKRCLHKDGSVVWVRQTSARHEGSKGTSFVTKLEDITFARSAEERLRGLVHTLGERVKELTTLHRTAHLLLQSRSSLPEQLQAVAELLPGALQYPTIATACVRHGDEVYQSGRHAPTPWMLTAPFQTAEGRQGAIEVAYHEPRPEEARGPFFTEEVALLDSLAEMVRAGIDRQSSEHALADAKQRLDLAFDAAGVGLWEWNVLTHESRWSHQLSRTLGLDESTGVFARHRDLVHPDDRGIFERLKGAAAGEDDLRDDVEIRMRTPDGRWLHIAVHARILRDPSGRIVRIVAALVDVTELRRTQAELVRVSSPAPAARRASGED